jgi:hypothetical protein
MGNGNSALTPALSPKERVKPSAAMAFCLALVVGLMWAARAATFTVPVQVSLAWSYPTNGFSTDLCFVFLSTSNVNTALAQWPFFTNAFLTNLVSTNLDATGTNANFTLPFLTLPGQGFYVGVATNFWGSSDFSGVASTPPVPRSDVNLRMTRP